MTSFTSIVAQLTTADCHPGRLDHVVETCGQRLLQAARKEMGYRGSYLLVNRDSSQLIALSLWDTSADARAFQASKPYQVQLLSIGDCVSGPIRSDLFDIDAQS